jgi:hypothetical protein
MFRVTTLSISDALAIIGGSDVYWMRMSPRSATVARSAEGQLDAYTARVRRRAGETFEQMLIRLADALIDAPTEREAWKARRAEKAEREGRREERLECESLKIVTQLKRTLMAGEGCGE